jgi:hypothetical protein
MQQILSVWTAMWDPGESGDGDGDITRLSSLPKRGGAVDVGVKILYHTPELLFKINMLIVIVCVKYLNSTSYIYFFCFRS